VGDLNTGHLIFESYLDITLVSEICRFFQANAF